MKIDEDEVICNECKGTGYILNTKRICKKCYGTKKVTWIENIFGKYEPPSHINLDSLAEMLDELNI